MRPRARFFALVTLLLAPGCLAAALNDFSDYPAGAQSCLSAAADASGCTGNDVAQMNACLCGNSGNFVMDTAQCVGQQDAGDLKSVYETMKVHCQDSNTPIILSEHQFLEAGAAAEISTTSTTPATSTSTASATSTSAQATQTAGNSNNQGSGGLSQGATVTVAVVSAIAGTAVIAAAIYFAVRYSRRKQGPQDDAHLMLFQPQGYGGGGQLSSATLSSSSDAAWPSWRQGEQKYPYGPGNTAAADAQLQPEVYELADTNSSRLPPVELPTTPDPIPVGEKHAVTEEGNALYEPYRSR